MDITEVSSPICKIVCAYKWYFHGVLIVVLEQYVIVWDARRNILNCSWSSSEGPDSCWNQMLTLVAVFSLSSIYCFSLSCLNSVAVDRHCYWRQDSSPIWGIVCRQAWTCWSCTRTSVWNHQGSYACDWRVQEFTCCHHFYSRGK